MIQEILLKSDILRITTTWLGLYKIYITLFSTRFAFGVLRKFEFIKENHRKLNTHWFTTFLYLRVINKQVVPLENCPNDVVFKLYVSGHYFFPNFGNNKNKTRVFRCTKSNL